MLSKEDAFQKISGLVDRFEDQYEGYKRAEYNETQTRRDFIDPFFKALGWDVDNEAGNAEGYREVIHEDKVKVGDRLKAPDYSFRLSGGKRLFFVEAKKPHVIVKDDVLPAYQIRRYGWSAKLPISLVTDFEEFAVYDCTKKPNLTDKASVARLRYLNFKDYLNEFDFLWETFSKERVLKGSFDKFITSDTHKKGTATVDKEFLNSLDEWRTYLATSISWNNKQLDEDELNFAVQQIIDRIIFLRIAEDRAVEHYGNLKECIKQGEFYKNLVQQFIRADEKYNSGLFDFRKDKITKGLVIENKIIKNIISDLYYPESPYEFSVLSVEILGSAYEQFLGKVIRIDKAHRAKIEEKPEVRKAGGVYYTPQYIVDYIVKNTVGKLIEGKIPKQVSEITICDPACGSGSFLIGAYQFLLDWHKNYYLKNHVKQKAKDNPITPDGNLTTAEKKRILLNNIYGVDIDLNAVEVTKLSLLLKCMEGETEASIATQLKMFNERVLPTLEDNIKCGNSLIDTDFYDAKFDFGEEKKIKPFNWQKRFPEVFKNGGFDVVIGNPPYVRQELLGELKKYFETNYKVFHGMADLYSYFIEKGIGLLSKQGLFGFIVANKWMRSNYGEPLRRWLKQQTIHEISDFGDLPVFESATTYPCILIAGKPNDSLIQVNVTNIKTLEYDSLQSYVEKNQFKLDRTKFDDSGWNLSTQKENDLLYKLKNNTIPLGEYVKGKVYYGIKTGLNEAFIINENTRQQLLKEDKRSAEIIRPFLAGRDIKRYQQPTIDKYLIFIPKGFTNDKGKNPKNGWKWLSESYPAIASHLKPFEDKAKKRFDKGDYWWELRACDYYDEFEKPKIMLPDIALRMQALLDVENFYCVNTAYIIPTNDKYLLALLNSKLINYFYSQISSTIRGGYLRFIRQYLLAIPIHKNIINKIEIENLVDKLISSKIECKNNQNHQSQIQSKIEYVEDKIDEYFYKLYELSEIEISLIESSPKNKFNEIIRKSKSVQ